jgi:RNA-directed DNA polymerase
VSFDRIPHDRLLRAVEHHAEAAWVLLYVRRWLVAPLQQPDGTLTARDRGSPQGSLCPVAHKPPYAQFRVMRSAGLPGLGGAGSAGEHCA